MAMMILIGVGPDRTAAAVFVAVGEFAVSAWRRPI
jgi:hypothetical protein